MWKEGTLKLENILFTGEAKDTKRIGCTGTLVVSNAPEKLQPQKFELEFSRQPSADGKQHIYAVKSRDGEFDLAAILIRRGVAELAVAMTAKPCGVGTPGSDHGGAEVFAAEDLQQKLRGTAFLPSEDRDNPQPLTLMPPETSFSGTEICSPPYKLPPLEPDDDSKTMYEEAVAKGPQFAGKYAVVFHGCGMYCSSGEMFDVTTGKTYRLPYARYGEAETLEARYYGLEYDYNPSSNTMTANWMIQDENGEIVKCVRQSLRWTGSRFVVVKHLLAETGC